MLTAVHAFTLYPEELLSQIRFYHLQESFYDKDNEPALWQMERYLAQDLVDSIEEASVVIGLAVNAQFLPPDHYTTFGITQRLTLKFPIRRHFM